MDRRAVSPSSSRRFAAAVLICAAAACRSDREGADRAPPVESALVETITEQHVRPNPSGPSDTPRAAAEPSVAMPPAALPRFAGGEAPVYPEMSRRLGEEGVVELRIEVLQDGSVASLVVSASSGHPRLDAAALAAAKTWRFNPRTGERGADVILHRVVFRLVAR